MKKGDKIIAAVVVMILAVAGCGYLCLHLYTDCSPTFTNVESESMQHDNISQIGTIDTGDMVVLKNKSRSSLETYVSGSISGYSSFGEYGDVVVYKRDYTTTKNNVIHRLILELEYQGHGKWSAPSLKKYEGQWSVDHHGTLTFEDMSGNLTLKNIGFSKKIVTINLDNLATMSPYTGYLTMGDNSGNTYFDQLTSINHGLVTKDDIVAVAWLEFPFGGIFKMVINGKMNIINKNVPNAIPSMILTIIGIIAVIFLLDALFTKRFDNKIIKYNSRKYYDPNNENEEE